MTINPNFEQAVRMAVLALIDAGRSDVCRWHQTNDDVNLWEGACGCEWRFTEGGPLENQMRFCPECGRPMVILKPDPGGIPLGHARCELCGDLYKLRTPHPCKVPVEDARV